MWFLATFFFLKNYVFPSQKIQCFCPLWRRLKTCYIPKYHLIHSIVFYDPYIRILQTKYIYKSINQSIMSYPVYTLAMPFVLQDCYKNRVSFWCSQHFYPITLIQTKHKINFLQTKVAFYVKISYNFLSWNIFWPNYVFSANFANFYFKKCIYI